jgi:type III secretion protein V
MPSGTLRNVLPRRLTDLGSADAALALMVIAVVGLMIVPLPTWLLDILLAANISLSVGILLVVLYIPNALAIATFPTLLLITTLLRLALNVSSSRLILLQADAGDVIRAFGNFVVRGNYVVGAVVFLILTIIQFVVIAKGSERVAEVGARFALDAMPGKQMAIDAEMRAGSIDGQEAKHRRFQLARESQFYGAMDGAMKFVKGDVIASLVITVINILGGLTIGVMQRGMDVGAALKRYGLLTIGDGLVTQIPALVLATAAGILVTRVASEDEGASLGEELAGQLFGTPKAIRVAGVFVVLLALVPGLPVVPFLFIGAVLLIVSRVRTKQLRKKSEEEEQRVAQPRAAQRGRKGLAFVPVVTPWAVHVGPGLQDLLEDERRGEEVTRAGIRTRLTDLRERLFAELGAPLPPAVVRVSDQLPPMRVVLSVFEVPYRAHDLAEQGDVESQLATVDGFLFASLRERAAEFIGIAETQMLLDQLEQVAPPLPRQVVPKPISLSLLSDILRRLVEEGVSVRDLRGILEALAQAPPTDKDPLSLAEFVRSHLRRATTFQLTGGMPSLSVYLLDPEVEEAVRNAVQRTPSGSFLALSPRAARDILTSIRTVVSAAPPPMGRPAVLLTQPDVRRFVRKLVEAEFPEMRVVSYAELMPEISLRPLGRATVANM